MSRSKYILESTSKLDWEILLYFYALKNKPRLNTFFYYEMDMWLQGTEKVINCPSLARNYEFASEEDKAEFILKWM